MLPDRYTRRTPPAGPTGRGSQIETLAGDRLTRDDTNGRKNVRSATTCPVACSPAQCVWATCPVPVAADVADVIDEVLP